MGKYKKIAIAIGGVFIIIGFLYDTYFAGIPFQDPTQEMIDTYNRNSLISNFLMILGICIILLGLILKRKEK
jgi:uncharacterized membrane protein